jgi:predicted DNA-binding transcriptional regulator AlpA
MSAESKTLLTPRKAAEYLGVPESTLAQWRSQRRGPPYIKLEMRLVRYRSSDLEVYLGQHFVEMEVSTQSRNVRFSAI